MALELHNTLGGQQEEFKPISPGEVKIYGCGPTVYKYAHIGNLRPYVFQDTLKRVFLFLGYKIQHVMNITDIGHLSDNGDEGEDKMIKSARERSLSVLEIADFYTKAFFYDTDRMNIIRPTITCKATEHISDMIELIKKIEANGHTYISGGNLYFDISTFPDYGRLANIKLDSLKAGARILIDENKKNPHDFVLWFTKSKFEKQALVWDSPWGKGYPGWHIECSAMSIKYLGEQFDIHTGGVDHIRVHHTNEIAQSESATGKKWVNYWLHNEFLVTDKGKMSKSSGEFLVLDSIIEKGFDPLDYRFFLLSGHYRSQLAFSWESMETAKNARRNLNKRISRILENIPEKEFEFYRELSLNAEFDSIRKKLKSEILLSYLDNFKAALEKDISVPNALSVLQILVKTKEGDVEELLTAIAAMDFVLGLNLLEESKKLLKGTVECMLSDSEIESLIKKRRQAKAENNYSEADEIRNFLNSKGIVLEDKPDGTVWKTV